MFSFDVRSYLVYLDVCIVHLQNRTEHFIVVYLNNRTFHFQFSSYAIATTRFIEVEVREPPLLHKDDIHLGQLL